MPGRMSPPRLVVRTTVATVAVVAFVLSAVLALIAIQAYVGAMRALALALDARDPYTAGHSERVSAISVATGRQMQLPDDELDVLRLGRRCTIPVRLGSAMPCSGNPTR
jgi:HD-GYP domain-containing protein (c-di-GMP phosphodiesterase class II)